MLLMLGIIKQNFVILSDSVLNFVVLGVFMLNFVMLSVMKMNCVILSVFILDFDMFNVLCSILFAQCPYAQLHRYADFCDAVECQYAQHIMLNVVS
jgi:hypothetical protein